MNLIVHGGLSLLLVAVLFLFPNVLLADGELLLAKDNFHILHNQNDPQKRSLPLGRQNGILGERCGIFNSCAESLSCVKAGVVGGRCYPVECYKLAVEEFTAQFDMEAYKEEIFETVNVTPEQMMEAKRDSNGDQDFASSDIIRRFSNAMEENPIPHDELKLAIDQCTQQAAAAASLPAGENTTTNSNAEAATTPGTVLYSGFHMEGGVILDGSFSVFRVFGNDTDPTISIVRACISSGGVGFDVSALIGIGFTGTNTDLQGCSVLITDFELGLGPAFGIGFGIVLSNDVLYLDFTLGLGVTGEGFGFGICGNWPV